MHGTMLTNLIMRGVIKGRGVGGRAFHLGALTLAPWHCPLLQLETLTSAYTHTRTHKRVRTALSFIEKSPFLTLPPTNWLARLAAAAFFF